MATTTSAQGSDFGIDVAKKFLQIEGEGLSLEIPNTSKAVLAWLKGVPKGSCFAVEATNTFHILFVGLAQKLGHTVYLIDGYRLSRYRDSIGGRAKTDRLDARLLRRYLCHEREQLRPWVAPPAAYTKVLSLLQRRERVVNARVMLQQSLADLPECAREAADLMRRMQRLEKALERRITAYAKEHWEQDVSRCRKIEGFGPLTSSGLATAYQRGEFRSSDAFVAFIGLDVRARDSGTQRGKRKLTKKGPAQLRRLLYTAAMAASRSATWRPFYQRHRDRGLSATQALVALARKLARVAFSLMKNASDYVPAMTVQGACPST